MPRAQVSIEYMLLMAFIITLVILTVSMLMNFALVTTRLKERIVHYREKALQMLGA